MVQQFEAAVEQHVPGYSSSSLHRSDWAASVPRDLFVLEEQSVHDNPVPLRNLATLSDLLNSQTTVRAALKGELAVVRWVESGLLADELARVWARLGELLAGRTQLNSHPANLPGVRLATAPAPCLTCRRRPQGPER